MHFGYCNHLYKDRVAELGDLTNSAGTWEVEAREL